MLEFLCFIFNRGLQPVIRIQIHNYATLIKSMMTPGKICLHNKGKILLLCFYLQNRRIIVSEVVIGPLPQIGMRFGLYPDRLICNAVLLRLSRPLEIHTAPPLIVRGLSLFIWSSSQPARQGLLWHPVLQIPLQDPFFVYLPVPASRPYLNPDVDPEPLPFLI